MASLLSVCANKKVLTQKEFAKALKTSQSAVARMESGQQNLTTDMLQKIGEILNRPIIALAGDSVSLKIEGGHKLSGQVATNTSKNAAMGLLCASLLNAGQTTLQNVPRIEEVNRILEVLGSIGVKTEWHGQDLVINPPKKIGFKALGCSGCSPKPAVFLC